MFPEEDDAHEVVNIGKGAREGSRLWWKRHSIKPDSILSTSKLQSKLRISTVSFPSLSLYLSICLRFFPFFLFAYTRLVWNWLRTYISLCHNQNIMQKCKRSDSYLKEMLCNIQVRYTISKIIESNWVDQKQSLLFHEISRNSLARFRRKVLPAEIAKCCAKRNFAFEIATMRRFDHRVCKMTVGKERWKASYLQWRQLAGL